MSIPTAEGSRPEMRKLQWQVVLAVGPRDPALLAGFADGQLRRPFGALGGIHDLVAQLVVTNFVAHICQSLCDVGLFDFASSRRCGGWLLGRREPQSAGIELKQPRRLRSRIAKLETQLDGGELRSRPCEQQVAVAHRMQSAGAAKGAADLVTADGFADVVHDDESSAGGIAQTQQRLAQ